MVDILAVVSALVSADASVGAMAALGYEGLGEDGLVGRRHGRTGGADRSHRLHVYGIAGAGEIERHPAVPACLRAPPAEAGRYGPDKAALAARHPTDSEAYRDGKDAFAKALQAAALAWRRAQPEGAGAAHAPQAKAGIARPGIEGRRMPTPSPATAARPLTVVSLSAAGHFFNDGYANVYPTLVPLVAQAMGFGLVSGALVITAVRMASSILQPLFGAIADRRPSPFAGPVALGVTGIATALLGFVHPAIAFVALAVVAGAANGAYHPPSLALVRMVAGARPGGYTSIFLVGGTAGRAVGPLLMVAAAALFGMRGVTVLALPGIALAALLFALAPRSAANAPARAGAGAGGLDARSTWTIVRDRLAPFSLVLFMAVARSTVTAAVTTFWPLLHGHALGALFSSAGVIAAMMLAGSLGNVVGGNISDRLAPHRLLAVAAIGGGTSLAAFALAGGAWVYLFAALAGLFAMSTNAVTAVLGQNLMPERVATASGLVLGFANALTAGVTALLALAAAAFGGQAALLLGAGVAILGLPAALAYPLVERRHEARARAGAAAVAQNA